MRPTLHFQKLVLFSSFFLCYFFSFSQVREEWVKSFNTPESGLDSVSSVATDPLGNVYVTGGSQRPGAGLDFVTIKYNTTGKQLWLRRYNESFVTGHDLDFANAIAVDAEGNVFVTGISTGEVNDYYNFDYATIKYDADGNEIWVRRYDGGSTQEWATSLALDEQGNVYVTGNRVTIKYNTYGGELWVQNRAGNFIAIDASANVYVMGSNNHSGTNVDYSTTKINSEGTEQWTKNEDFSGTALVVDAAGNVYVTGSRFWEETLTDYATVKYDTHGNRLWFQQLDISADQTQEDPIDIEVDAKGNVYVTGTVFDDASFPGAYWIDYLTVKYDTNGNLLWAKTYGTPIPDVFHDVEDRPTAMAVDQDGNVYITGVTNIFDNTNGDYATLKYDPDGNLLWVEKYVGPDNNLDEARSVAVDGQGNVYVSGFSQGSGTGLDYATIKYGADGKELWVERYTGSGLPGRAASLAVDNSGNVYVTGNNAIIKYDAGGNERWFKKSNGNKIMVDAAANVYITGTSVTESGGTGEVNLDYSTTKYNKEGSELWVKSYSGPVKGMDVGRYLAVDASGNVYVTGSSHGSGTGLDYATIKYDASGKELWVRRYNSPVNGSDEANALAIDGASNVYVTGSTATVKYDAAGNQLWTINRGSSSLAVDAHGNVYLIGRTTTKYNTDGMKQWERTYTGPGEDYNATALAVDDSGNVYVAGVSFETNPEDISDHDYVTIKYNTHGNELWVKTYLPGYGDDYATALAIDSVGGVYVTGNYGPADHGGANDIATIKYNTNGEMIWEAKFNSGTEIDEDGTDDEATSIAVDTKGNVYVTGRGGGDYITIKYIQVPVVTNFTLIDAISNKDIGQLRDGAALDFSRLPLQRLNIRANTNPSSVGSVILELDGPKMHKQIENTAPYALLGNKGENYYGLTPEAGDYVLTATPYSGKSGSGEKGTSLTIRFHVYYQAVNSFTLINADTDQDIQEIKNGQVIDLALLATKNLNIRANTTPDSVGSIGFVLLGHEYFEHLENVAPYALLGNNLMNSPNDFYGFTPEEGSYSLLATPYAGKNGSGQKGKEYSLSFTIVDGTITKRTNAAHLNNNRVGEMNQEAGHLTATPNPFREATTLRFSVPQSGYTALDIYDMKGVLVKRLFAAPAQKGTVYQVAFQRKQLSSGIYMARLVTGNQVTSYQLVLVR